MAEPNMPSRGPYVLDVQPGTYAWCACGRSKRQPYCDGSHAGTGFSPIIEVIEEPTRVAWCGCKRSIQKPFCDGSHSKLPK